MESLDICIKMNVDTLSDTHTHTHNYGGSQTWMCKGKQSFRWTHRLGEVVLNRTQKALTLKEKW